MQSLQELGFERLSDFVKMDSFTVVMTKQQENEDGSMSIGLSFTSEKQLLDAPQSNTASQDQQAPGALMVISEDTLFKYSFEEEIEKDRQALDLIQKLGNCYLIC